jgi:hypothetical protein
MLLSTLKFAYSSIKEMLFSNDVYIYDEYDEEYEKKKRHRGDSYGQDAEGEEII